MIFATIDLITRSAIVLALACASVVALTHWLVRSRRITPFGVWPRFMRRASDPVLLPLERRILRAGGNPQDAPLWLLGIVIAGGLLLLTLVHWLAGFAVTFRYLAAAGSRAWLRFAVGGLFTVVMIAVIVRVIASWFGISPYHRWMRVVMVLTDWIVDPIRRILPPLGMIDFSPLVAWLVLSLARSFVLSLL
ncbi:MAG TPA: YggT family protein [Gemmatimonadales bacterium]|nr:YggT family protein [Gemmatimonadales bacterium]